LTELGQALWFFAAATPLPDDVTLFGRKFTGLRVRTRVQAAVIEQNLGNLVQVGQVMANNVPAFRSALINLARGEGGSWIIPAMVYVLPFALQSFGTWRDPIGPESVELAERVEANAAEALADMAKVEIGKP
jgi:hypothetical protein